VAAPDDALVSFALGATPTPEARAASAIFLFDTLAVGVAGSAQPSAERARRAAASFGGPGACRLLGRADRHDPATAAFLNGHAIHCLEWDALHEPSVVIALCAPAAALLAAIDARPASAPSVPGAALLDALSVGVEVAVAFGGMAAGSPRFFRPSTAGGMGAAMALARLHGLDAGTAAHALGLAYAQAQGVMQAHWEGTGALALQVGGAARAAVTAVALAEAGADGPRDVMAGKFGWATLIEPDGDAGAAAARMGRPWAVTQCAHKPFPAGRATQATLTALHDWRGAGAFASAAEVARLTARVPPLIDLLVGRAPRPDMTASYARLCLRFVAPLYLLDGAIDPARFTQDAFRDPAIVALGERVEVVPDGNPDPNVLDPQTIILDFADGRRLERQVEAPLGAPANPLSREQREAKAARAFAMAGLDAGALIALCAHADAVADARAFIAASTPEGAAACH
jgi:2-methylcitrate dehydratase PrpD